MSSVKKQKLCQEYHDFISQGVSMDIFIILSKFYFYFSSFFNINLFILIGGQLLYNIVLVAIPVVDSCWYKVYF